VSAPREAGEQVAGVDEYRFIGDAAVLESRGLFVAEGRFVVERLVALGTYTIRSLLLSPSAARQLAATLAALDSGVPVFVRELPALAAIAGYNIHRGCLALAERPEPRGLETLTAAAGPLVVLEGVGNPDNVGSVFRNAAAFGAAGVLLSPACADPLYRKAIRTSMAAALRVPFVRAGAWPAPLAALKASGIAIVALTAGEPSVDLEEFAAALPPRIALLVGSEGEGLSEAALALADVRVRIPIAEAVDSLNLATAAAIALYRLAPPTAAGARSGTSTTLT
jgi:tRNA G18 (ribose-2'-O)-methylase SpoU